MVTARGLAEQCFPTCVLDDNVDRPYESQVSVFSPSYYSTKAAALSTTQITEYFARQPMFCGRMFCEAWLIWLLFFVGLQFGIASHVYRKCGLSPSSIVSAVFECSPSVPLSFIFFGLRLFVSHPVEFGVSVIGHAGGRCVFARVFPSSGSPFRANTASALLFSCFFVSRLFVFSLSVVFPQL